MERIPSDGWMSDFRKKWLSEAQLADLMEKLERKALKEKLTSVPGMRAECRTLYADGSKLETHATPPIVKKNEKGEVIGILNEWRKGRDGKLVPNITAPDAGYVSPKGNDSAHSGPGWKHYVRDEREGHRTHAS